MLNLSRREQAKRFLNRIDHQEKNWKFSVATAAVVVQALRAINPRYPAANPPVREQMAQVRAELVRPYVVTASSG